MSTTRTRLPTGPPSSVDPVEPLTRRTRRFAKVAEALEDACSERGMIVDAAGIDGILNDQISDIARRNGTSTPVALRGLAPGSVWALADEVARYAALAQHLLERIAVSKGVTNGAALLELQRDASGPLADEVVRIAAYLHPGARAQ
jgi:hypothetical protein